jgi:general secretion pathway protein J
MRTNSFHRSRGFTLIELLVAIGIMAVMAGLSWQGIDGMVRAQTQLQHRADALLTLQAGLGQWSADLDALADGQPDQTLDWDGRCLRLLRRNTAAPGEGLLVVAWSRRTVDGVGQWLRWQSTPLRTRQEQQTAWASAAQWAQNAGDDAKKREVRITPLTQWELFYFRNNAWSHPLSSSGTSSGTATGATQTVTTTTARPDGVRLVLTLPDSEALRGTLTRDWVRPTLSGGKS